MMEYMGEQIDARQARGLTGQQDTLQYGLGGCVHLWLDISEAA